MAIPRTRELGVEPDQAERSRHESGTRRVLRENVAPEARFTQPDQLVDPWASDDEPSLLSVASWLVDSVRRVPDSKPPAVEAPSISITEDSLSVEELAAVEAAESASGTEEFDRRSNHRTHSSGRAESASGTEELDVRVEQGVLSFEELEAIDDFELAPLRRSFERGDNLGLLIAAEELLQVRPSMSAALRYRALARESLRRRYIAELGGQQEIPRRLKSQSSSVSVQVDKDEAFMLSLIDGLSTLEEIVDRSQLPEARALELVDRLCVLGLVGSGARHASYC